MVNVTTEGMLREASVLTWMANGHGMIEQVALRFRMDTPYHGHTLEMWLRLDNEAAEPGTFEVGDAEVREALAIASGLGYDTAQVTLWHTHTKTVEPSEHDLEHLPTFAVEGLVFHVPSQTTTSYMHGMIYPSKAEFEGSLVDTRMAPHG